MRPLQTSSFSRLALMRTSTAQCVSDQVTRDTQVSAEVPMIGVVYITLIRYALSWGGPPNRLLQNPHLTQNPRTQANERRRLAITLTCRATAIHHQRRSGHK